MNQSSKEQTTSLHKPSTSSNTSANDTTMNPAEAVSEDVQQLLSQNNDIADAGTTHLDGPVYELYSDENDDVVSSEHQLETVNAEIDKLVAEYTRKTEQEIEKCAEPDAQSSHDSSANQDLCIDERDVDDVSILMDNSEKGDCDAHITESSSMQVDKTLKEEPEVDGMSQVDDDINAIDTSEEEGSQDNFISSREIDDPANAMHLAAVVTSSLAEKTELPGPTQSTASQTTIKKRIDVLSLLVVDNPLQKEGRHTVIRGRLPDGHPFLTAAKNLGYKLVSKKLDGFCEANDEESRRDSFHKDLREFLKETHSKNTKLPIIGGGNLDLYGLMKEVLLLGGVENVVKKRAFRIVAQQLELPKSCTSAAYVLKGAYEKFLYFYETRLVFGTWPDNTGRRVDMKSRVTEQKQKEKLANQVNQVNGARKRRRLDQTNCSKPTTKKRAVEMDSRVLHMLSTISNDAPTTHRYLKLLSSETGDHFVLPEWTLQVPEDGSYLEIVERIQELDESNEVRTSGEVILLAMAECFQLLSPTGTPISPTRTRDLGLAKAICLLPTSASVTRKAQACLFSVLVQITKLPSTAILSSNQSAKGLLDGIFSLVQIFYSRAVDKPMGDTIPFINSRNRVINRDAAAAYCGLRIMGNFTKEPRNRLVVVDHPGMGKVLLPLFNMDGLYRDFVVTVLDILQDVTSEISKELVDPLLQGLLPILDASCKEEGPDYDVSTRALTVLCRAVEEVDRGSKLLNKVFSVTRKLLRCQISIVNTSALGVVIHTLVDRFPDVVSGDDGFIEGLFVLLRDTRCTSLVAESLARLHRVLPLHEFASRAGLGVAEAVGASDCDGEVLGVISGLDELTEGF